MSSRSIVRAELAASVPFILVLLTAGCDDGGGADGSGRGMWQSSGKADETATCVGACGAAVPTSAGCWCDAECSTWGDCCPDHGPVCDGVGGEGGSAGDIQCSLPNSGAWSCNGLTGLTNNASGKYYTTSFGCWVDEEGQSHGDGDDNCIPACSLGSIGCSGKTGPECERALNWYSADSDRFGCGTKLLVTNPDNDKSAVLVVIDRGPNCKIEDKVDHWVLDMSYPASNYLFGGPTSATDRSDVLVELVDGDVPLGPSDGSVQCGADSDDGFDDGTVDSGSGDANEVCFPQACFPLVALPTGTSGYDYPPTLGGDPNYRKPIAYIDLETVDLGTMLTENFALSELASTSKGRYAVVQPHAVEHLQEMRDALGPLGVNSGYRSPAYNAQIGGAESSRHMYGDGYDIEPIDVGLTNLEQACGQHGGFLVEYDTHAHCDWRDEPIDPAFFGVTTQTGSQERVDAGFAAELRQRDGVWSAPASGFDEGEPKRRWTALATDGTVLVEAIGETFVPPPGAAEIRVRVGAVVERWAAVP